MPTGKRHPVEYRPFALYLDRLPLSATCAELVTELRIYPGCEETLRQEMIAAVEQVAPETGWLDGLMAICTVLKERNARFVPALFLDWATEGK